MEAERKLNITLRSTAWSQIDEIAADRHVPWQLEITRLINSSYSQNEKAIEGLERCRKNNPPVVPYDDYQKIEQRTVRFKKDEFERLEKLCIFHGNHKYVNGTTKLCYSMEIWRLQYYSYKRIKKMQEEMKSNS